MAKTYKHLLMQPQTKKKVQELLNGLTLSQDGKATLERWIVFEKEAETFMEYLKKNPQANEEMLRTAILQIAWEYAKSIGMSTGHRENWSVEI